MILSVALVVLLSYALRIVPLALAPHGLGVDHWYWKKYVETYREQRRFPPEIPQYRLDAAQWYPPVFPLLLSKIPSRVFDRWDHQLAIFIDLARLGLLLAVAAWQTAGNPTVVLVAGLVYATTPVQVSYNIQLNPRGLGALMLDALLMMLLWTFAQDGPWWGWVLMSLVGGLILLTHKMTTQLFWFVILGTALIYGRWDVFLLIPASMVAAFALSAGFYGKVLRAHADIVAFWNRNWRWIGADLLRESPIYGDPGYERPQKLHRRGVRGVAWHLAILFGFNPAAWVACFLVWERLVGSSLLIYPTPFLVWLLLPCLFALLTTFVPFLKCFGAGYLYVYNTSVLSSLVLALTFEYTRAPRLSTAMLGLALLFNVFALLVYYRQFRTNPRSRVDEALSRVVDELARYPPGLVMCLPSQWAELVAYRTTHPVLWGAHGYGFKLLEPIWPRMQISVAELFRRYDIRYLLTTDTLLVPPFVAELPPARVVQEGLYRLYCFDQVD